MSAQKATAVILCQLKTGARVVLNDGSDDFYVIVAGYRDNRFLCLKTGYDGHHPDFIICHATPPYETDAQAINVDDIDRSTPSVVRLHDIELLARSSLRTNAGWASMRRRAEQQTWLEANQATLKSYVSLAIVRAVAAGVFRDDDETREAFRLEFPVYTKDVRTATDLSTIAGSDISVWALEVVVARLTARLIFGR